MPKYKYKRIMTHQLFNTVSSPLEARIIYLLLWLNQVYEEEQARCPQRAQRLTMSMNPSNFHQQRGGNKPARSFTELTNDPNVFKKLHQSFTWLLKVGGNRLTERLFEGPPTEDSVIDLEKQEGKLQDLK